MRAMERHAAKGKVVIPMLPGYSPLVRMYVLVHVILPGPHMARQAKNPRMR